MDYGEEQEQGWELHGGHISRGSCLRKQHLELYEETGILGTAKSVEGDLIYGGYVVLVELREVGRTHGFLDESIEEVGWCLQVPESSIRARRKSQLSIMTGALQAV